METKEERLYRVVDVFIEKHFNFINLVNTSENNNVVNIADYRINHDR